MAEPHRAVYAHGIQAARLYASGDLDDALTDIQRVSEYSKVVVQVLNKFIEAT